MDRVSVKIMWRRTGSAAPFGRGRPFQVHLLYLLLLPGAAVLAWCFPPGGLSRLALNKAEMIHLLVRCLRVLGSGALEPSILEDERFLL
jgi:hypothetical protein